MALTPGTIVALHEKLERTGTVLARRGRPSETWFTRQGTRVMVEVDGQAREWKLSSVGWPAHLAGVPAAKPASVHPAQVTDGRGTGHDLRGICTPSDDAYDGQVDPDAEGD